MAPITFRITIVKTDEKRQKPDETGNPTGFVVLKFARNL
jgi:hypothetical protein